MDLVTPKIWCRCLNNYRSYGIKDGSADSDIPHMLYCIESSTSISILKVLIFNNNSTTLKW
jgi:hypothetical protein